MYPSRLSIKAVLVALFLTGLVHRASAQIASEEDLVIALQTALKEKNADKLNQLFYFEGMSAEDKEQWNKVMKSMLAGGEVDKITLLPVPKDMPSTFVIKGRKLEPTYPAAGLLKLKFKGVPGPMGTVSTQSTTLADAKINGGYYLTATKGTPLIEKR